MLFVRLTGEHGGQYSGNVLNNSGVTNLKYSSRTSGGQNNYMRNKSIIMYEKLMSGI